MTRHTVLLVDDEPDILNGLKLSMRKERFAVETAASGPEALEIMAAKPVDVVVSDHQMPGMKGTELLARVAERHPDTARFVLTGNATVDMAVEAINKGSVSRMFLKPCVAADLVAAIRDALEKKELMAQARLLLKAVQEQSARLESAEAQHPGITQVRRDSTGSIILDDIPEDYETFVAKCHETLLKTMKWSGDEG